MHHVDVYTCTCYATCHLEMDIARHAKLRKGEPAIPSVKKKRNAN